MAKDLELSYLLDFYGDVLTEKQREMMEQYYNDDLSLSEVAENFGITRQGVRDAVKHGEATLRELEQKVGFAARYRTVQERLTQLEALVRDAKFRNAGAYCSYTSKDFDETLDAILDTLHAIDETQNG